MKNRALISVYNKDGITELASFLEESGWEIIATGGTSKHLRKKKIPVTDVSSVTGFPECLDGRVKTLHPAIHAGLLARRDDASHIETLKNLKLETINLVCVNLYPFFEKVQAALCSTASCGTATSGTTTSGTGLSLEEAVEFIDIGGPAMLRSAAKNFRDVIVLTDPADYAETMKGLKKRNVSQEFRKRLAGKVFDLTSAYDAAIARYLLELDSPPQVEKAEKVSFIYPSFWPLSLKKEQSLRYGENSHQSGALYLNADRPGAMAGMEQLNGKELSYNNIRDLDSAWKAVCAFGLAADGTKPIGEDEVKRLVPKGTTAPKACCVAVKHNCPCGIALGDTLLEAFNKTMACDPVSIFGAIIASNVTVDKAVAKKMGELFLELIVAPDFESGALKILKQKKNLRIVKAAHAPKETKECFSVDGGMLVQETDKKLFAKWEVVTRAAPAKKDIPNLIFGMRAVTFVKSNAILIVKDLGATGIGGGQANRIWPTIQALARSGATIRDAAEKGGPWADGENARVLASDGFFPFSDGIEAAAGMGIKAVIQPGGSKKDDLSIEACDRYGVAMVFTGTRHFKH